MSSYIRAVDVHAPKRHWSLVYVLFDGGPGDSETTIPERHNPSPNSLAIGRWDNEPVLAMRWNGNEANPLGNPQSRGLPTWFIVPEQYWKQILETEHYKFSGDKIKFARDFLEFNRVYFLNRCPNPACSGYQQLVLHSYRTGQLAATIDDLTQHKLKFYHVICDHSWKPNMEEEGDLAVVLKGALDKYLVNSGR